MFKFTTDKKEKDETCKELFRGRIDDLEFQSNKFLSAETIQKFLLNTKFESYSENKKFDTEIKDETQVIEKIFDELIKNISTEKDFNKIKSLVENLFIVLHIHTFYCDFLNNYQNDLAVFKKAIRDLFEKFFPICKYDKVRYRRYTQSENNTEFQNCEKRFYNQSKNDNIFMGYLYYLCNIIKYESFFSQQNPFEYFLSDRIEKFENHKNSQKPVKGLDSSLIFVILDFMRTNYLFLEDEKEIKKFDECFLNFKTAVLNFKKYNKFCTLLANFDFFTRKISENDINNILFTDLELTSSFFDFLFKNEEHKQRTEKYFLELLIGAIKTNKEIFKKFEYKIFENNFKDLIKTKNGFTSFLERKVNLAENVYTNFFRFYISSNREYLLDLKPKIEKEHDSLSQSPDKYFYFTKAYMRMLPILTSILESISYFDLLSRNSLDLVKLFEDKSEFNFLKNYFKENLMEEILKILVDFGGVDEKKPLIQQLNTLFYSFADRDARHKNFALDVLNLKVYKAEEFLNEINKKCLELIRGFEKLQLKLDTSCIGDLDGFLNSALKEFYIEQEKERIEKLIKENQASQSELNNKQKELENKIKQYEEKIETLSSSLKI